MDRQEAIESSKPTSTKAFIRFAAGVIYVFFLFLFVGAWFQGQSNVFALPLILLLPVAIVAMRGAKHIAPIGLLAVSPLAFMFFFSYSVCFFVWFAAVIWALASGKLD